MADEGKLGLRIYAMVSYPDPKLCPVKLIMKLHCGDTAPYCGNQVEKVYDAQGDSSPKADSANAETLDGRYTFRSAKLFGDGALGSRGAALLDDYSDKPGSRGFLIRPEQDWEPLIREYYETVSQLLDP
jgi:predicted amidohydrolase YtcJ